MNSGTGNLAGLEAMRIRLQKDFSPLGGEMEEIALPPRRRIDDEGNPQTLPLGKALRIRKRPDAPFRILLAGHYDTVYPEDSSFQSSRAIDSNRLQGPGTADMKGGLLVLLEGLKQFESSELAKHLGWELLIVPDEEVGSPGSTPLFREAASRCQLALLFEPSLPDGALVSSRKGSWNATITARGIAAHSGREFEAGRNAISALSRLIVAADALSDPEKGITVNFGSIRGGGPVNIVPELAICRFNIRFTHREQAEEVRKEIPKLLEEIAKKSEVALTLDEDSYRPPKMFDPESEALFHCLAECAKTIGFTLQWRASGGSCDGNSVAAEGIPVIDSMGVTGGNLHTHEEYLLIESIPQRIQLLTAFLERIATERPAMRERAK